MGHAAADGGRFFYDIYLIARLSHVQRGLNTGDAAADDQRALGYRTGARGERRVALYLGDGGARQNDRLIGGFVHFLMNPGALLADVGDLHHIGVQSRQHRGLAEGRFMHTGRTGADHHAVQIVFLDGAADHALSVFRAHVLIIGAEDNAGFRFHRFRHAFYIDGRRDIASAPAYKYANFLHFVLSPITCYTCASRLRWPAGADRDPIFQAHRLRSCGSFPAGG